MPGPIFAPTRRALLLAATAAPWTGGSLAQGTLAPTLKVQAYGVFSLVGEGLEMVTVGGAATSRLERGSRETQLISGAGFDRAVLLGARDALQRARPVAHQYMYRANAPLTADQQREVVAALHKGELMPWMQAAVERDALTRLICITRERGDAHMRLRDGFIGQGSVDGVGYYVDRDTILRSADDRLVTGFLAPYVYLRVTEIDAATRKVVRSEVITETATVGINDSTPGRDPWLAQTNVQKIETLRSMLQATVRATVHKLLEAP